MALRRQVDNGEPAESKTDSRVWVVKNAGIVGSAMGQSRGHGVESLHGRALLAFGVPETGYSAHSEESNLTLAPSVRPGVTRDSSQRDRAR